MDNRSISRRLKGHLAPGEAVIYQSPRKWSMLIGPVFTLPLLAMLFYSLYVLATYLSRTHASTWALPTQTPQADAEWALVFDIMRWGSLAFVAFLLIAAVMQFIAFLGEKIALTDRRILGRTGASILHLVDIPLESIAWAELPTHVLSKGPLSIRTRDGKTTILWRLAKPEVFLGYLEKRYSTQTMPVISRPTSWGSPVRLLMALAILAVGAYWSYTNKQPELSRLLAPLEKAELSELVDTLRLIIVLGAGPSIEELNAQSPPGAAYASAQELADAINPGGLTCKYFAEIGGHDPRIYDAGGCVFLESGKGFKLAVELPGMQTPAGALLRRGARKAIRDGARNAAAMLMRGEALLLTGQNWSIGGDKLLLIQAQSLVGGDILDLLDDAQAATFVNR
jgi:hypothetical protein